MALPERTAQSYGPGITGASKTVLLELMTVLRAYREALVLIGGWVPYLLLERHRSAGSSFTHVGSIDIDLAVDPAKVLEPEYATIADLLTARGYRPATTRGGKSLPHSFERTVVAPLTEKPYNIRIDFLTPLTNMRASGSQHILIQDELLARKTKGCETAFTHQTTYPLEGNLPESGGEITIPIQMADPVASLAMKGIVLGERFREKDAYDIYSLIAHYAGGPKEIAGLVLPFLDEPLVREGIEQIQSAFATPKSHGPAWVAAFLVPGILAADRERVLTDAFMVVNEFLSLLH